MIKIIAIDLDGTMLKSDHQPHDDNIKAIKKLKNDGYIVVIATGRPYIGVQPFLDILNFKDDNDFVICFNGAKIVHPKTNKIIYSSTIDKKALIASLKEANRLDTDFYAYTHEERLYTFSNSKYEDIVWFKKTIPFTKTDFTEFNNEAQFLKFFWVAPKEKLDGLESQISSSLKDNYNVVRSGPRMFEILDKNSNKGDAINFICNKFNTTMEHVMAIGDADNDISMIKNSKIGVAMANAFDSVKNVSDFITLSNDDGGVSHAINELIFKNM